MSQDSVDVIIFQSLQENASIPDAGDTRIIVII